LVPAETDGADLVGQITPYSQIEVLQHLPRQAGALLQRFSATRKALGSNSRSSISASLIRAAECASHLAAHELPELVEAYVQAVSAQHLAAASAEAGQSGSDSGSVMECWEEDLELLDLLPSEQHLLSDADQQAAAEQAAQEAPFGLNEPAGDGDGFGGRGGGWVPEAAALDDAWPSGNKGGAMEVDTGGLGAEDGWGEDEEMADGGQEGQDGSFILCEDDEDDGMWGSDSDAGDQQEADVDVDVGAVGTNTASATVLPSTAGPVEGAMEEGGMVTGSSDESDAIGEDCPQAPVKPSEAAPPVAAPDDAVPVRDQLPAAAPPTVSSLPGAAPAEVHAGGGGATDTHEEPAADAPGSCSDPAAGRLPTELCNAVDQLIGHLEMLTASPAMDDPTSRSMLARIQSTWARLTDADAKQLSGSRTYFMFRDGPVTAACKAGHRVLLEDFNSPSQAVTERLNSLLETEPSFTVPEDITGGAEQGPSSSTVVIAEGFQVFATVHVADGSSARKLNLSPASRSRFPILLAPPYSDSELVEIVQHQMTAALVHARGISQQDITNLTTSLFDLRSIVQSAKMGPPSSELHQLFKWAHYICTAPGNASLELRLLQGARFFYLDHPPQQEHVQAWWQQRAPSAADPLPPLYASIFTDPAEDLLREPVVAAGKDLLQLRYTHVTARLHPDSRLVDLGAIMRRMHLAPTPTLVSNMARIFAGLTVQSPLLLEGPPGTGKTAVVQQVAQLLGYQCERINLSASTTLDHLLGCTVPRVVNGEKQFEWQDGRLVEALREGRWLLLDEVNLAPSEVLEGIAPLLERWAPRALIAAVVVCCIQPA
jgi:hypothetical protein